MAKSCLKPVCCLLLWLLPAPALAQLRLPEIKTRLSECHERERLYASRFEKLANRSQARPRASSPDWEVYDAVIGCHIGVAEEAEADGVGCVDRNLIWREILEHLGADPTGEIAGTSITVNPDIIRAYTEISTCEELDRMSLAVEQIIDESSVLSILPSMLEQIGVKDLVPIINKMESKANKTPLDYLTIAELLAVEKSLPELEGGSDNDDDDDQGGTRNDRVIRNVEIALAGSTAPKVFYRGGLALWKVGEREKARETFREGLQRPQTYGSLLTVYVASLIWQFPFLIFCIGMIWFAAFVGYRRNSRPLEMLDEAMDEAMEEAGSAQPGSAGQVFLGVVVGTTAMAAYGFFRDGHIAAFALLFGGAVASVVWFASLPLRSQIRRVAGTVWSWLGKLFSGRLFVPLVAAIPRRGQFLILIGTLIFLFFVYPALPKGSAAHPLLQVIADLRLVLFTLAAIFLFVTVGSIILGMLRRSGSLHRSLWWLAAVGSIPFLAFYLAVEWPALIDPLSEQIWPSSATVNRVASYFIVWLVGAGLASTMGRIVARSIIDPLKRINDAVAAVRGGDFEARTEVDRRDEIGTLAVAVDAMAAGLAQRERIKKTLSRFVDPKVAQRLIDEDTLVMRGRTLKATVMFIDIRGFTLLSEGISPEGVVDLLNRYFQMVDPVVRKWGGVVDKFIGDGVLAVWDVPEPPHGELEGIPSERLATEAAVEILESMNELNDWLMRHGLPDITIGIGINSGELIAGPIGSEDRQEYTVVGDVVNTAQRTEAAARDGKPLLVTGSVAEALAGLAEVEEIEAVPLKGKHVAIRLFKVVELKERLAQPAS